MVFVNTAAELKGLSIRCGSFYPSWDQSTRKDTESTKNSEHERFFAAFQIREVEMDQQSSLHARHFHPGQHPRLMDPLVLQRLGVVRLELDTVELPIVCQVLLVTGLKQPGPKMSIGLSGTADQATRRRVELHPWCTSRCTSSNRLRTESS